MKRLLGTVSLLLAAVTLIAQGVGELIVEQSPFAVYSAFWPNLHHVLWAESGEISQAMKGNLSADEQAAWKTAVSYYREEIADLHPLFEMGPIRRVLLTATVELPATGLQPAHHQALAAAAQVYRKHWWSAHDSANRKWIADPLSKIALLSPVVPDRLSKLYDTTWFTRAVRVDVVPVASREGAFTSIDPAPAHITISSASPVLTGWTAAEVMFHEASHALVFPMIQAFAAEAKLQGKQTRDLWHVALFYLTGEVVRQALEARDITYEPYLYKTGLLDRAWPQFKMPIETHWKAYVNGEIPREEAIKRVVAAVK